MMDIVNETKRAIAKHGVDTVATKSWERVSCVLIEEAAEVLTAALDMTRDNNPTPYKQGIQEIYDEAKQTASVATRIMRRCQIEAAQIQKQDEELAKREAKRAKT